MLVLERGRRFDGDFPREADDDWLWEQDRAGPFDVRGVAGHDRGRGRRRRRRVTALLERPPAGCRRTVSPRWPAGWDREELDPYYDLVASMLDLRRAGGRGPAYWPIPPRAGLLRDAAHAGSAPARTSSTRRSPSTSAIPGSARTTGSGRSSPGAGTAASAASGATSARRTASTRTTCRAADEPRRRAAGAVRGDRAGDGAGRRLPGRVPSTTARAPRASSSPTTLVLAAGAIGTTGAPARARRAAGRTLTEARASATRPTATTSSAAVGDRGGSGSRRSGPAITTLGASRRRQPPGSSSRTAAFPPCGVLATLDGGVRARRAEPCPAARRREIARSVEPRRVAARHGTRQRGRADAAPSAVVQRRATIEWPWRENDALLRRRVATTCGCIGRTLGGEVEVGHRPACATSRIGAQPRRCGDGRLRGARRRQADRGRCSARPGSTSWTGRRSRRRRGQPLAHHRGRRGAQRRAPRTAALTGVPELVRRRSSPGARVPRPAAGAVIPEPAEAVAAAGRRRDQGRVPGRRAAGLLSEAAV